MDIKLLRKQPLEDIRDYLVDLLRLYVPCDAGDEHFEEIAQGRERQTPIYSSCGDLVHWALYRAGYRGPVLNRSVPAEHLKWDMGLNLDHILSGGRKVGAWVDWKADLLPAPGDACMIFDPQKPNHEHVFWVLEVEGASGKVVSADAGQVNEKGHQCARIVTRFLKPNGRMAAEDGRLGRFLKGWLDPSRLELIS